MLPDDAKIISVDDHVIEHPRVWLDRVPAKYADVAPRIVKLPDGNDTWLYEGSQSGNFALNAVAGGGRLASSRGGFAGVSSRHRASAFVFPVSSDVRLDRC